MRRQCLEHLKENIKALLYFNYYYKLKVKYGVRLEYYRYYKNTNTNGS